MRCLGSSGFLVESQNATEDWLETYISVEDRAEVLSLVHEASRTKSMFQLEHRVRRADGTLGWTFSRASPSLTTQATSSNGSARPTTSPLGAKQKRRSGRRLL